MRASLQTHCASQAPSSEFSAQASNAPLRKTRYLSLSGSRGCNLDCRYCKASALGENAPRLNPALARVAVSRLLEESEADELWINIHGGEPLLLPDSWWEDITVFAKNRAADLGKRVRFPLSSNGVLLTPERLERLLPMGLEFSLSVDGPPHIHDRYRQQGAATARALRLLVAAGPPSPGAGGFVGVTCTVHRANASELPEIMRWFGGMGVGSFQINFLEALGRGGMDMALTAREMVEAADALLETMLEMDLAVVCRDVLAMAQDFYHRQGGPRTRCQAGGLMLAMDEEGFLRPCAAAPHKAFRLGRITDSRFDADAAAKKLRRFHDRRGFELRCFHCEAAKMCRFACPMAGASKEYRERRCLFTRLLYQHWLTNPEPARRLAMLKDRRGFFPLIPQQGGQEAHHAPDQRRGQQLARPRQAPLPPICLKR